MPASLQEACLDPDLAQCFVVLRQSGAFGPGGWIPGPVIQIKACGIIQIADAKALQQVPEGDRVVGSLQIITTTRIYVTHTAPPAGTSDQVQWDGVLYRVQSVAPWKNYGFYDANLVRMKGE